MTLHAFARVVGGAVLLSCGLAPHARGQWQAGADATYATRYLWRGIPRAAGPVFQPDVRAGVRAGHGELSAGAWANFELFDATPGQLSDRGAAGRGLSEVNYWLQYADRIGRLLVAGGAIAYSFPREAAGGAIELRPRLEWFAEAQLRGWLAAPRIAIWADLAEVKGVFAETSLTVPVLANPLAEPFLALYVTGTAGWSFGEGPGPGSLDQLAIYAGDGPTHLDLALSGDLGLPLPLDPRLDISGHYQYGLDRVTRLSAPNSPELRRARWWLMVGLGVSARR